MMEDSYRHKGMRRRLLESIQERFSFSPEVLRAMYQVPRHFFLDKAFEEIAYRDEAIPIDEKQTISRPSTVACQTHFLDVSEGQYVLEIGTGSGYQAAVLAAMGARVYTVERHEVLHLKAKAIFQRLGFEKIQANFGDGNEGWREVAPFNRILVTAAASSVPSALLRQLIIGGKLVMPVGSPDSQKMHVITRKKRLEYETHVFGKFRFVPLLKGKN